MLSPQVFEATIAIMRMAEATSALSHLADLPDSSSATRRMLQGMVRRIEDEMDILTAHWGVEP